MKYSNEEKLSIVARYQQGERITALSNELAISRSTLYRWLKSFPSDSIGKPLKFSYQEYASLQRKVEKLQNIITILKSVDCLVSAPLKERLHALEPFYGKYEVHTICEALDVEVIDIYHDYYPHDNWDDLYLYTDDGLHPNEAGREKIAQTLADYLNQTLDEE